MIPGSRHLLREVFNYPQMGSKRFSTVKMLSHIVYKVLNPSGVLLYSDGLFWGVSKHQVGYRLNLGRVLK